MSIQIFENGEFQLHITPNGDSFTVEAPGLSRALGFREAYDLVQSIPDDEKGSGLARTPGGDQRVWHVTEPGFYRAIGQRQATRVKNAAIREQVIRFQNWVYREVLPAIRRTGSYSVATAPRLPDVTTPEGVLAMAEQFTETARALVAADAKIKELEPKAVAHDRYLTADKGDRLVREVAKLLSWKERDLRAFLLDEGLIFRKQALCGNHQYDVYARHGEHFRPVEKVVEHTWGPCSHYTLYVRPSGVDLIQRRIERQRAAIQRSIGGA